METAVLSEDPARTKSFELSLRASRSLRNGVERELQGRSILVTQEEKATDFHTVLFEVLTLDSLAKETGNG
jgi:hypothetical protein